MSYITPEKAGVSSKNILKMLKKFDKEHLSTHDIILAKGNDIFFEKYWAPFDENFYHRMYSITKSFVAIAVGFLEQDGLISLDDKIIDYFPNEVKDYTDKNIKKQTIRDMLKMSTSIADLGWFSDKPEDRVCHYFQRRGQSSRTPGTVFNYDSCGSFVLCALVERISKMEFMEYLRVKLFDKIGFSKESRCLKCPGGHSWGDSAILCTPRDLLLFARFVMNRGTWNGERILNEKFMTDATTKQVDNNFRCVNNFNSQGYGYQIWMTYDGGFSFNGMGCQYAICVPNKDLIMIYNADNQGIDYAGKVIFDSFFEYIVDTVCDEEIQPNEADIKELAEYTKDLKLAVALGEKHSDFESKINGVTYTLDENPMGIKKFRIDIDGDRGVFAYTNAQGDKELEFGFGENVFGLFPQEGYSKDYGTISAPGHRYKCASSAAWTEDQKLFIKAQVIDDYFGNLNITIGFKGDEVGLKMNKVAEDFMHEYEGYAAGIVQK